MRPVGCILKIKRNWINVKRNNPEKINFKELTFREIKTAKDQMIAQVQKEWYHEELNSLENKKLLQKSSTLLSPSGPDVLQPNQTSLGRLEKKSDLRRLEDVLFTSS